jgi:hypothetical protein
MPLEVFKGRCRAKAVNRVSDANPSGSDPIGVTDDYL